METHDTPGQPTVSDRSDQSQDVSQERIAHLIGTALGQVESDVNRSASSREGLPLDGLAELAHDLRSPLGAQQLIIERLRRGAAGPLTTDMDRHLGLLHSAARSMALLIDDAQALARSQANDEADVVVFTFADLFGAVRDLVQPVAEERRSILRFSSTSRDRRVGRAAALRRVLLNLVINALKHGGEGVVSISIEESGNDTVRMAVCDNGEGLPPAVVDWIAGRVSQPSVPMGIGLRVCMKLMEEMGGSLEYGHHPQGGCCLSAVVSVPRLSPGQE